MLLLGREHRAVWQSVWGPAALGSAEQHTHQAHPCTLRWPHTLAAPGPVCLSVCPSVRPSVRLSVRESWTADAQDPCIYTLFIYFICNLCFCSFCGNRSSDGDVDERAVQLSDHRWRRQTDHLLEDRHIACPLCCGPPISCRDRASCRLPDQWYWTRWSRPCNTFNAADCNGRSTLLAHLLPEWSLGLAVALWCSSRALCRKPKRMYPSVCLQSPDPDFLAYRLVSGLL